MPKEPTNLRSEDTFLRAFFSPPNGAVLSADGEAWSVFANPAQPAQAELLALSCSRLENRAPTLLPWIQSDVTVWYGIAFDPLHVKVLQQWLRAFVGRTFGSFSELPVVLGSTNEAEPLLRSLNPASVFSIKVSGTDRKSVSDQIARLLRLLSERPDLTLESWDTSSSLLRSFFAALAADNPHLATEALSRLRSGAFLDAVNLSFLEIQLLAAREDWSAIAHPDRLKDILLLRRPLRIDSLIAAALYHTHLAGKEKEPTALLEVFKDKILPVAGTIFSRQFLGDSSDALRCYLIWRVFSAKDPELIAAASSSLPPNDPLRHLAERRIEALDRQCAPPTTEVARNYAGAGDWQSVLQAVAQLAPSDEVLALSIRAAAEIGTVAAAQFATTQWSRHSTAHHNSILASRWLARMWKAVSDASNENEPSFTPANPGEWFSRLGRTPDWPQAQPAWDRGVGEWSFEDFAVSSGQVQVATSLLATPPTETRATLRQVLPQLLGQIPEEHHVSRSLVRLHLHAAEFLATTDMLSEEERELMVEASLRALEAGLSTEDYSYLVDLCFTDAWQRASSPRAFPWALSLLELLVDRPTCQASVRASFAETIFTDAQRYAARLSPGHMVLLRELLKVMGLEDFALALPETIAPQAQAGEAQRLSVTGIRRVGIYSLMEPAAKRAQSIINGAHPNLEVVTNADHAASNALRNMSRDCDALFVVTSCAKHAATICIEQNRRDQPLIYINGKGSSSILNAWSEFMQSLPH